MSPIEFRINVLLTLLRKNKEALTAAFSLACLEIRSRNEEAINSTRNMIYSLKFFLLPSLLTSILFICFWIDLVRVLATTRNTSPIASIPEKLHHCQLYSSIYVSQVVLQSHSTHPYSKGSAPLFIPLVTPFKSMLFAQILLLLLLVVVVVVLLL